jgi:uncharacterized protein YraI
MPSLNIRDRRTSRISRTAGAALLCAALTFGGHNHVTAASLSAPAAQADCTPSAITTTNVNFRTGPGTNFPIIKTLPATALLTVTGVNAARTWYQVVFNGEQGWVIERYLRLSCVGSVPVIGATTPAPTPAPPAPPTGNVIFTANATTINFGQCAVLRWNVPAANQVLLSTGALQTPVQLAGTQQVCPSLSTRFYLQTETNGGRQVFPQDITVTNPYNPANFRSNAYTVRPGECPTLSWNVENVNGVFLFENNRQAQGVAGNATRQVCVSQPSNFALRVVGNDGRSTLTPLTINVVDRQPANVVLIANPAAVPPGGCAQLQWIAGNARTVNLLDTSTGSNTRVGGVGDVQVCPSRTATYTIRAVLPTGAVAEQSQTVTVANLAPTPIPLP